MKVTVKARVPAYAHLEELPMVVVEASGYGAPRTVCPAIYHPMPRHLSPHDPLYITPCPAIYYRPMPRCLSCPAIYRDMPPIQV